MNNKWTSKAAKWICEETNLSNPKRAILKKVSNLQGEYYDNHPPINPVEIANLAGIQVQVVDIREDGYIQPTQDGLVINLNKNLPETRQRFTCAHEIVHSLFYLDTYSFPTKALGFERSSLELERLCDLGAAELLMPTPVFTRKLNSKLNRNPPCTAIRDMAETFCVSPQAVSKKVWELQAFKFSTIGWRYQDGPDAGSEKVLRIDWVYRAPNLQTYIPRYKTAPSDSGILRAWKKREDQNHEVMKDKLNNLLPYLKKDDIGLEVLSTSYKSQVISTIEPKEIQKRLPLKF